MFVLAKWIVNVSSPYTFVHVYNNDSAGTVSYRAPGMHLLLALQFLRSRFFIERHFIFIFIYKVDRQTRRSATRICG